ncbi:MAG: hypothetical protein ACFFCZ_11795 [Promethearchaeota archaeon]
MKNGKIESIGFIFDVDGCLTLPIDDAFPRSILDVELMDTIYELNFQQIPITFVTGRSVGYLKQQYELNERLKYQAIPTYLEFGLVKWVNGEIEVLDSAKPFLDVKKKLIDALARYCIKHNIYFEASISYDDHPEHGWMWLENKIIQLSIAAGRKISASKVHEITLSAWKDFSTLARFLPHHLGIDVVPVGWSKSKATENFISTLDHAESSYQWFVLGDNESDREMTIGLSQVTFVDTKKRASKEVWDLFDSLKLL